MAPFRNSRIESGRPGEHGLQWICCKIVEHSLDAVLLTRPDGGTVAANPAACRLFGRSEEELISLGRQGLVDSSDPRLVTPFERRTLTGHAVAEMTFIRADGTTFVGETTSSVFPDADGNEVTCMIIRDVTGRKMVELALQESEERFRLAMEAASDGLWDWDIEAGTGYFSPGCYRMLGYEPDEFTMTIPVWLDFIHPEDRDRTVAAKTACIENRAESFAETFRMKQKSGRWVWVLGRGRAARRGGGGRALRMLGTHVDITDRKVAEQNLQQLNEELEKRVRERTSELESSFREMESFCHSVSHELRAPIARIEGFCNLLEECLNHEDPEGIRHCAERLGHGSRRIRAVIDALLSIHRLGRADMHMEAVNLSALARQTIDVLVESIPPLHVRVTIAPDVVVVGDRRMLGICLQNLLENAVKYTGKTVSPAIEFGVARNSDETVYFVRDNGAGFDMAFANKLFQPFSRLHNDEEFAGSGIGLATVQRIVERHCGQIWAEASPGNGATIYFTLGTH